MFFFRLHIQTESVVFVLVNIDVVDEATRRHLLCFGVTIPWHFSVQCSFVYTAGRKTDKGSRLRVRS